MVKNVVVLLLHSVTVRFVAHNEGVNALQLHIEDSAVAVDSVDHIEDLVQSATESVELAEDVVLAVE